MAWTRVDEVTIYTSWRGIATTFSSPLLLLAIGIPGVSAVGMRLIPGTILVLGIVLMAVALFDVPLQTRFDRTGIHRICLLRRHRLDWAKVRLVQRARGNLRSYARLKGTNDARLPSGGLVASLGGIRRYQLTDRIECRSEYDMMRDVIRALPDELDVEVSAARPAASSPPTTLYRRGIPNPPPPADA